MAHSFNYEYTDTFAGEANYSWVKRGTVTVADLVHFGYDGGTNYVEANTRQNRAVVRAVKAALGLTGMRCVRVVNGDVITLRPVGRCSVIFISFEQ